MSFRKRTVRQVAAAFRSASKSAWGNRMFFMGILAVLLCTVVLVVAPLPAPVAADLLPESSEATAHHYRAIVVLQPGDCVSAVEFLRMVQRPEIHEEVLVEAIAVGSRAAADSANALLHALGISMRVHPGNRRTLAAVAQLGHRTTPLLVVFNHSGAVRFASASPSSANEFRELLGSLRALAQAER